MITNKADTSRVPKPMINATPPINSINATPYAKNPGNPILSNHPTVLPFRLEISLTHE